MKKSKIRIYKGLPLIDASNDMVIEITKADVIAAERKNPGHCAAAKALSRSLNTEAEVYISRTYIKDKNKWIRFITPEAISREITSFDRSSIFEPGEYTLKAPGPGMRLGYKQSGPSGKKNPKSKKRHITINVRESAGKK